jgi:uncharacterized protein
MDCMNELRKLLKLQKIDIELSDLNKILCGYPAIMDEIKREYIAIEKKIKQIEDQREKAIKERKKWDIEIEDLNIKMSKYQLQLMDVKNNKEYTSMLNEIEILKKSRSELEDKLLEAMEFIEVYEKQLRKVKDEVLRTKKEVDEKVKIKEEEIKKTENQIALLKNQKGFVISEIEQELLRTYEKIWEARGNIVLSRSNDGICQGCNSVIRPHVLDQIREMKEIVYCERCQRFMYWESPLLTGIPND